VSVQAGIWNFDGEPIDPRLIRDFSEILQAQGPDGEFVHVDGAIALLYRPFHTTAESRREKQPFVSRRGFLLTWDGRLDNRNELIADLRRDLDAEPTDVAIVGAAFDRWETDCFRHIVGDWAVSVWRFKQHELLFSTDYSAIRHIFYYLKKGRIWWSTDLAPLVLLSGDKFHIDDNYIAGYFAHDADAYLTPYREIREVPPGQFVRIRDGSVSVDRYWRFSPQARIRYKTDAEYEDHFRHVFRQSVRRRLRGDSTILAELSGGLDSSSIVCMADDIMAKERASTPPLDTLSYYDTTEPDGDDWTYLQKVEKYRGRTGAHIDASKLGSSPVSLECSAFEPFPGSLGSERELQVERAAVLRNGGYRTVLSGIGGDEFTGGVPNPSGQLADLILQFKLITLARQLIAWSLVKRRPWIQMLAQAWINLLPPSIGQHFLRQGRPEPWIQREFARRTRLAIRLLDVDEHFGFRLPSRRSHVAGVILMANKLSKWSSSVLAPEDKRYPYLDRDLVQFLLSIPASQLLRPGQRRSLMRRSLAGIVPQEILFRRTKQFGARTPIVLLEKNLAHLKAAFESPLSSHLGYINNGRFLEALDAFRNGKEIHTIRMLKTVSLEFWLRDVSSRRLLNSVPPCPAGERLGTSIIAAQRPSTTPASR